MILSCELSESVYCVQVSRRWAGADGMAGGEEVCLHPGPYQIMGSVSRLYYKECSCILVLSSKA